MRESLINVLNIFINPRKAFQSIDKSPDWVVPFILISTIGFIITFISFHPMEVCYERIISLDDKLIKLGVFSFSLWLKCCGLSFVIWAIAINSAGKSTYKKTFSLVMHSSLPIILHLIISMIIIFSQNIDDVSNCSNLEPKISLSLFLFGIKTYGLIKTFLSITELYLCWTYILIFLGISVIFKISKIKSALIVFPIFILINAILCLLYF